MRSVLNVKEMLHIATMLNGRSNDVSCCGYSLVSFD